MEELVLDLSHLAAIVIVPGAVACNAGEEEADGSVEERDDTLVKVLGAD